MKCVIVPNVLRDAIYAKIDAEIATQPDAAIDRDCFYQHLLNYYDEHGTIPDFELVKRV